MSRGLKLQLEASFTDTSMPVIRNDKMLTHGSLSLVRPVHGLGSWKAGVPANGDIIPNIAVDEARALGLANPEVGAIARASPGVFFERTPKGGLHGIVPQATAAPAGAYLVLDMSPAVRAYILANPGHSYFASLWSRTTRLTAAGVNGLAYAGIRGFNGETQVTYHAFFHSSTGAQNTLGFRGNVVTGLDPMLRNVATSNGVLTSYNTGAAGAALAEWGRVAPYNSGAADIQRLPSWIFYGSYLEDLTVSGRTYADVDALDLQLFTAEFANGGKYFGDTFTSPSTIP